MFCVLISQVQILKVGVLYVGFKPFAFQREAWGFEFPSDCGLSHLGWALGQDCVSASPICFDVDFFLFAHV